MSDDVVDPAFDFHVLRRLVQFAYEQGYHELGYDPVKEIKDRVKALSSRLHSAELETEAVKQAWRDDREETKRERNEALKERDAALLRLDDALMRLREAIAWFDVVKSKHDTVALIHLADDWPNYWLKITRDLLNGAVEKL